MFHKAIRIIAATLTVATMFSAIIVPVVILMIWPKYGIAMAVVLACESLGLLIFHIVRREAARVKQLQRIIPQQ